MRWTQERALASEQRLFREKLHDLLPRRIAARRIDAAALGTLPPPERLVAVVLQASGAARARVPQGLRQRGSLAACTGDAPDGSPPRAGAGAESGGGVGWVGERRPGG